MSFWYVVTCILMLFLLTVVTRALPFIVGKGMGKNKHVQTLSLYLPAAIMLLLVIYEVKIPTWGHFPHGIDKLLALAITAFIHIWRRNMILSIIVGTVAYMLLHHYIFLMGPLFHLN